MTKPTVFNYQDYVAQEAQITDLTEENGRLKEKVANLEIRCRIAESDDPAAYWTDEEGNRDDKSGYSLYCSGCKQWSEYRGNYCINCGRKMINPEVEW